MTYNINIPNRNGTIGQEILITDNHLVMIGANGSGKTRLGVRIEELTQNSYTIHRISAQKALGIPDFAEVKNLEQAEKELLFGRSDQHANNGQKMNSRWGQKPATHLLNDYSGLLSLLFAKSSERDRDYTLAARETGTYQEVPNAPIDDIISLWNTLMPHREVEFKDGKVIARKVGQKEYHGQEMSDGERVILYLIGQCLSLPENSIIIIDEPEIHLHKTLVDKLWNKIESFVQNKLLIYITHNLEFAASRIDSKKLWIKEYNGENKWVWKELPSDEEIPESLMLEIIGNRKNVIFCEGENGKYDSTVYQLVYPDYHVIPRGSGVKAIEATKSFNSNPSLHHLTAVGIIDADYKEPDEILSLESDKIFTNGVAEIENLFCIEPVLRIIADHLELDPEDKIKEVVDYIAAALTGEFDVQVSSKAEKIVEYKLGAFSKESNSEQGLNDGLTTTLSRIDINQIYSTTKAEYQTAINDRNLDKLLLIYNRKSLVNRISGIFGLANGEYQKLLVRLLKGSRKDELVSAIKSVLPEI